MSELITSAVLNSTPNGVRQVEPFRFTRIKMCGHDAARQLLTRLDGNAVAAPFAEQRKVRHAVLVVDGQVAAVLQKPATLDTVLATVQQCASL